MSRTWPIGVLADCFRVPYKESIAKTKELGIEGVQLYATNGELSPENLSNLSLRKTYKKVLDDYDIKVAAFCGDLGGHGFERKEENKIKIEKSKKIVDLAIDFKTNIITTHIGVIPEDKSCRKYQIMQEACYELGEYARSRGACFAIETGPEKTSVLKEFLDSLTTKGIGVNFDPANLVMVTGDDPIEGVYNLKDYIVHTHVKDGLMLKKADPQIIYNFFAEGGIEDMRLEDYFRETPLGEGGVDFKRYLQALDQIGYKGFLTIEREVGMNPEKDIRKAVKFLQEINI